MKKKLALNNRLFANRSMNMDQIQLIGFDMDHTLAVYKRNEFEELAFHETLKKFISAGYPQELQDLKFKQDFLIRGLLVDKHRGNLLKVDAHKYVKYAYHGLSPLSKEERTEIYNKSAFDIQQFISVDTFFALSEIQLFAEIVEFMKTYPERIKKPFAKVYDDLKYFIDLSHKDGSIKQEVLKNPEKFVRKDKYLSKTLVSLLDADKNLFLLTNSDISYTMALMSYLLNGESEDFPNWQDYFDIIIVSAQKPDFFKGSLPFFEIDQETKDLRLMTDTFLPDHIYWGGNAKTFQELTGYRGDEVLFVGDHIYGDIITAKAPLNWRTMLIIDELNQELEKLDHNQEYLEKIKKALLAKEEIDEGVQKYRAKCNYLNRQIDLIASKKRNKKARVVKADLEKIEIELSALKEHALQIETDIKLLIKQKEELLHPLWGSLMNVGLERSRFAKQVRAYACLYSSKVSNMRFYSPSKKFVALSDLMPHET